MLIVLTKPQAPWTSFLAVPPARSIQHIACKRIPICTWTAHVVASHVCIPHADCLAWVLHQARALVLYIAPLPNKELL